MIKMENLYFIASNIWDNNSNFCLNFKIMYNMYLVFKNTWHIVLVIKHI